eukprot:TRINITY_DN5369_c0_g1_i1.p1 TRINITY_DN5369_c0_g1~~TRINITY_DN5369_c0_g1_i1.p1  ORF type:complete len:656 (-),score=124.00 TRINITY_DN5369_c0_g1_i1:17-1984(-)
MAIQVVPLGAGQDVGRSCVIVTIGGKNIMFDCGMHMSYTDEKRFPDFSYISKSGQFTQTIDCVCISHFHLDHCGGLPYFTEIIGYDGPIYMTYPTKAICPILLDDFRKIAVERKGESNFFTKEMIKKCMSKVRAVNLHQTIQVDDQLTIKAYYAGHVLGAAMFYAKVGNESVVYTGDYNMTPDRHLGAAWIDKIRPDLLITETTYATTIRDSKRCRESEFLKRVHECVENGGKVLIPVFALGRAQELCILIESYWEQMNLGHIPVYFSAGMVEAANLYYKLFINWTNQKIKKTFVKRNMFDFKHIRAFDRSMMDNTGPMVLFASPGMLHAGMSLEVFKKWAPDEKNLCIIPGYCVVGTVGNKLLTNKQNQTVEIDKRVTLEVRCQVKSLSFSAHADAKGIMQLIKMSEPKNVLLVHGEKGKMRFLKQRIIQEVGIPCFDPANGVTEVIPTSMSIPIEISVKLLKRQIAAFSQQEEAILTKENSDDLHSDKKLRTPISSVPIRGVMLLKDNESIKLLEPQEIAEELGVTEHKLKFVSRKSIESLEGLSISAIYSKLSKYLATFEAVTLGIDECGDEKHCMDVLRLKSIHITIEDRFLVIKWDREDEESAMRVLSAIEKILLEFSQVERHEKYEGEKKLSFKSSGDHEPFIPMEDCE